MGDYYNATRGTVAVTLRSGQCVSIRPKDWLYVPANEEGSGSIVGLVSRGILVRAKVPKTIEAIPEEVVVNTAPVKLAQIPQPVALSSSAIADEVPPDSAEVGGGEEESSTEDDSKDESGWTGRGRRRKGKL